MSVVRLLSVHEDSVEVADIDVINGTPLLDIKPYVPEFDSYPGSKAGWFDESSSRRQCADERFGSQHPTGNQTNSYGRVSAGVAICTIRDMVKRMSAYDEMTREELLKSLQLFAKNWLAHDGCWFLAAEEQLGIAAAIELDTASWARFAAVEARRIMTGSISARAGGSSRWRRRWDCACTA